MDGFCGCQNDLRVMIVPVTTRVKSGDLEVGEVGAAAAGPKRSRCWGRWRTVVGKAVTGRARTGFESD